MQCDWYSAEWGGGLGGHRRQVRTVVNFDLPGQIDDYIHRIGRTGRAVSLTATAHCLACCVITLYILFPASVEWLIMRPHCKAEGY